MRSHSGPQNDKTELQADEAQQGRADPIRTSTTERTDSTSPSAPADDRTARQPLLVPEPTEGASVQPLGDATAHLVPPPEDASEATEQPDSAPAQPRAGARHVPGYRLLQPLGAGTYGEVWLAEEERTGIRSAIKFLSRRTGVEWQLIQAEVKQLALLHSDPGIVQLLDVELEARPPYYIMAYAESGSLARQLENGPLPLRDALGIFRQLAVALAYVHAKGIRHCDLKPGNVLLNARARPLLADFGQAHLSTDMTPALGTFFYMAPEQADLSEQIPDTRWDVYSLGAIFYAMVTGQPPRDDPEVRARLADMPKLAERLHCYREWVARAPKPDGHRGVPGVDRELADIIDRCLETNPRKRLHDAGAILTALARRERLRRQRPLLVCAFALQLVLFVLMGGAAVYAARAGLGRAEVALTEQLLESDRVSAALVASGLEQELLTRQKLLERLADHKELRRAASQGDRQALRLLMEQYHDLAGRDALKWLIVDAEGTLLAFYANEKAPEELKAARACAGREWFHGGDERVLEANERPPPPIRASHVSQPFVGRFARELIVGISTPVFHPDRPNEVAAVLFTPVTLREIQTWLDKVNIKDGFAVLMDRRGHCLRHPDEEKILASPNQPAPVWSAPAFAAAVRVEGSTEHHLDPIDGKTYLASYAPLPQVGWGALVQHERNAALHPIEDLTEQLLYLGLVLLIGVPVLLSALWATLLLVLRRRERVAQG